jgi:hypothetical protein
MGLGFKLDPEFKPLDCHNSPLEFPYHPAVIRDSPFLEFNHLIGAYDPRMVYISKCNRINVVSPYHHCCRTDLGPVISLCSVVDSTNFNFAALSSEGKLFFVPLYEDYTPLIIPVDRISHSYKFDPNVFLLSIFQNDLVFFMNILGEYFIKSLNLDLAIQLEKIPKYAFLRWTNFISEKCLRVCYFVDGEETWFDFIIHLDIDIKTITVEERDCHISGQFLGSYNKTLLISSGNDCICIDSTLPNLREGLGTATVLKYINYVASSKSDRKFITLIDKWVAVITNDKAFFYEQLSDDKTCGKQWIQEIPNGPIGVFSNNNHDGPSLYLLYESSIFQIKMGTRS